jgi:hypothetical protein
MLHIVHGACTAALDTFRTDDTPVAQHLVDDLDAVVRRTQDEIERLSALLAKASQ